MRSDDEREIDESNLRVARILVLALVLGLTTFLVIAVVVARSRRMLAPDPWGLDLPIDALALVDAVAMVPLAWVLPAQLAKVQRKAILHGEPGRTRDDTSASRMMFQTHLILGAAMLEGAAFFNGIAYLIGGHAWPLLAAVGLLLLILSKFPTQSGYLLFIEDQREQLRAERLMNG